MINTRVFLVEDNRDDETLALEAFRLCGISSEEIQVARDGQEAVDRLLGEREVLATSHALALVLLDLKLPKLNGVDVLARLRSDSRTKLTPVVFFSSSRIESDIRQCLERGGNAYVCKPIDFALFTEAVRQIASFWLRWNEIVSSRREA